MSNELFLFILAALFAALFVWAFRALPKERWQIIAAVPLDKDGEGEWRGLNLTYYGFFQAVSNSFAVAIAVVLFGAVGIKLGAVFALAGILLSLCWPAAKLITRVVEKKRHLFTVGGAVFVGTLTLPWAICLLNRLHSSSPGCTIPVVPALAAVSIAYAYGEALGRLACISFGCCYGKSLQELPPWLCRLFTSFNFHFKFTGALKKATYEGRLEGVRVAPIQAITSVIFVLIALGGTYLFLKSWFVAAMLLTMTATQLWRFLSEKLRACARKRPHNVSAYQLMALSIVIYVPLIAYFFPVTKTGTASIEEGLRTFWNPVVLVFCQLVWIVVFFITGRSNVTGSKLSLFVRNDRI
jgi:hypothetical protein